jgi:uncharacterized protein with GYD domain
VRSIRASIQLSASASQLGSCQRSVSLVSDEATPKIAAMPHYITLMRWTSQGMAGLPAWRERVEEGERIIQASGGSLIGVYVTLGRYDVVEIFEAPNDELAAEILMKLQRHGAEHTETLRGFTREEAEEIIRRL